MKTKSEKKKLLKLLSIIKSKCEKLDIKGIYLAKKSEATTADKLNAINYCLDDIKEFETNETPAKLKEAMVLNI